MNKDFRNALDQSLSGLRWDERDQENVLRRVRQEESKPAAPAVSHAAILAFAMVTLMIAVGSALTLLTRNAASPNKVLVAVQPGETVTATGDGAFRPIIPPDGTEPGVSLAPGMESTAEPERHIPTDPVTATPMVSPRTTATARPITKVTATPIASPTATATPIASPTATATPTATPTASPTATATPTVKPTRAPTNPPTATPTVDVTPLPTSEPMPTASVTIVPALDPDIASATDLRP